MKSAILLIFMCFSAVLKAQDIPTEQINFKFMSTEGDIYTSCLFKKGSDAHQYRVDCSDVKRVFSVHMFLKQYHRNDETVYEFHYWVNESANGFKSNTQSTWLSVNKNADAVKIISYVGLDNDANQLRVEIRL